MRAHLCTDHLVAHFGGPYVYFWNAANHFFAQNKSGGSDCPRMANIQQTGMLPMRFMGATKQQTLVYGYAIS